MVGIRRDIRFPPADDRPALRPRHRRQPDLLPDRPDHEHALGPVGTRPVVALERVYDSFGEDVLGRALDVIIAAWPQTPGRFRGEIVRAVAHVISQDEPEVEVLIGCPGRVSARPTS